MSLPLWYSGVCDRILFKVNLWDEHYDQGAVYATRSFFDESQGVIDIPTVRRHEVAWEPVELQHLVRILEKLRPKSRLLEYMIQQHNRLKKEGQLLPGGRYLIGMAIYHRDVKELLVVLNEAQGKKSKESLSEFEKSKQGDSSGLWETKP